MIFCYKHIQILVLESPLTTLSALRIELLEILHNRYPAGLPRTLPDVEHLSEYSNTRLKKLPESAGDIEFAKLVTDNETGHQHWESLQNEEETGGREVSLKSLGLKDESKIAFRFYDKEDEEEEWSVRNISGEEAVTENGSY